VKDFALILKLLCYCRPGEWPALLRYALLKALRRPARIDLKLRGKGWTVMTNKPSGLHFFHEVVVDGCYSGIRPDLLALPGPLVIDGGANCGAFALWALSENKEARVISFEPGEAFENLAINRGMHLRDHDDHWQVEKCALSSQVGVGHFQQDAGSSQGRLNNDGGEAVPMRTVDDLGLSPEILKIDVEGHEMEVLKGSEKTLNTARVVVLEYHSPELREECKAFLSARDFALEGGDAPIVGMLIARKQLR